MAVYAPRFDLLGTFACYNEVGERETEGQCNLNLINFSHPAVARRKTITLFTTIYSKTTATASMFSFRIKQRNRQCTTSYLGEIQQHLVGGLMCSTFNTGYSPLFYKLAAAAAEVGYFTTVFPPPTVIARGYFVAAKTSGLLKILIVDRKVSILPPGVSQFYHKSQITHTSLSEEKYTGLIEPGVLFIYVTTKKENELPQGSHVPVERNGTEFIVPSALTEILDIMYPPNASSDVPHHMESLLKYFHMLNKYRGMEDNVHNKHYAKLLNDESSLDQIIDVLVASADFLKPALVRKILKVFGKKIDDLGGIKTLKEYGALLGFIMKV